MIILDLRVLTITRFIRIIQEEIHIQTATIIPHPLKVNEPQEYEAFSMKSELIFFYCPESGGGWLCRTFGGICDDGNNRQGAGALGILGLVALVLKKLKLVKLAPFLPLLIPILPILLPIGLIIIIPIFIAAWFLPVVPVVVVGRALSVSAVRNVQETLLSENCLERISCEAFRVSRGLGFEAHWVHQ